MDAEGKHSPDLKITGSGGFKAPWNGGMTVQDAQTMFQRVLGAWAMDLLSLRQRGLDVPRQITGDSRYAPAPVRRAA